MIENIRQSFLVLWSAWFIFCIVWMILLPPLGSQVFGAVFGIGVLSIANYAMLKEINKVSGKKI